MKLKGLGNRAYNVLFHTHTVSGIVISFALFVIFYAGAYALFRHEITQWENPTARVEQNPDFDYDLAIHTVDSVYGGLAWGEITNIVFPEGSDPFFKVFGAVATSDSTTERMA
ncbi:MAG: PepSY-associated TM helix domain-containing protein, partial [Bacteroidota bacterium]